MARIQHALIPDNKLHEPKGAAGALENWMIFAKGDGTTEWKAPTWFTGVEERGTATHSTEIIYSKVNEETKVPFDVPFSGTSFNIQADGTINLLAKGSYSLELIPNIKDMGAPADAALLVAFREGDAQVGVTHQVEIGKDGLNVPVTQVAEVGDTPKACRFDVLRVGAAGNYGVTPYASPVANFNSIGAWTLQVIKHKVS